MKILVTGASGLFGHELAHRLCTDADDVRVLLRNPAQQAVLFSGTPIECMQGSLENIDSLERTIEDVDKIYHCAAPSSDWATWDKFYSRIIEGVRNLFGATVKGAPNLNRFLHVSTPGVYGYPKEVVEEEADLVETDLPYNKSKAQGERLVRNAYTAGKPVSVARPAIFYGPRDCNFVTTVYQMRQKEQWEWPLISSGRSSPGLIHVSNAARRLIGAARSDNLAWKKAVE